MKAKLLFYIGNFLVLIINMVEKVHYFVTSQNKTSNSIFESLVPSDNVDPDQTYSKALDWSLQNKEIKNVALSGPYGSGKSSLLKTFEKKNSNRYNFLNISLLTTQTERSDNDAVETLEKSILQQMFYKVKDEKIPFSRFKRINNVKDLSFFYWLFTFSLFLFCMIELFKSGFLKKLLSNTFFVVEVTNQETYKSILIAYTIIFLFVFLYRSYKVIYKNLRLSKITLKNTTLEVMAEKSVFSKYIDEILYFFEATKYNVVYFEDLDRFKNLEIFENLRELNALINNSEKISRKVTFIYAIKDDMFGEKDRLETSRNRTKFFDFIVPVVPIINSSNSGEVLKNKLENENIGLGITESFISDITIFIDDMRLLKNIFNEYVLYKSNLGSINLIPNNLLAIIVYKNIYPSDFAKLQFNEGMVYNIFEKKNELVQKRINAITNDIEDVELKIIRVEQESLNSIEELTAAYAFAIFGFHNNVTVSIDGTNYNHASSASTLFTNIESARNIRVHNGNWINSSKEELLTAFNTKESFYVRQEAITNKIENRLNALKVELQLLKESREEVRLWSMIDLIQQSSFDDIFTEEIANEKLLVFLLRNGHIDETYHQYITYFYPGSLSIEDMRFIMSVKNQESLPFNHNLNKLPQVIERLYANDFKRPEILNIHLLNFIIKSGSDYTLFLKMILAQLSNGTEGSTQFVDIFRKSTIHKEKFIEELCKEWPGIWKFVELESIYPEDTKEEYLLDILYYASIEDIQLMNRNNVLLNYLANKDNFLDLLIDESKHEKVNEIISSLQIKFKVISSSPGINKVLKHIYLNNLYDINRKNIDFMLRTFGNPPRETTHHCYDSILKSNCTELIDYVNENIIQYISNVYLAQEIIYEDEATLVILLNKSEITFELRQGIIQKQEIFVTDLMLIEETELWSILLINNKMVPTWENLIGYLEKYKLDDAAKVYLNQTINCQELSKNKLTNLESASGKELKNISEMIIESSNISSESFNIISKCLHRFVHYPLNELPIQRIQSLINNRVLALSPENFIELKQRNSDQNLQILLIENEPQKFLETLSDYKLNPEEIVMLLRSRYFNVDQKWMIVQGSSVSELPTELEPAEVITKLVLENGIEINTEFLTYLMETQISVESKLRLMLSIIKDMENDEIMINLTKLGSPYSEITERKRPLLDANELTLKLVKTLSQRDLISSYKDERGAIRVHTKQRMNG
ncbi:YobI family P-loop NTPase [Paenibacillus alginolyticus]|uniref:P-loop NTPase fold protein n=1 Tax=Paenibacillus alginolyticus TaxID=59839 RepID=A0ABT4GLV0_9BACL|nr:P-loop NTPase fold protein [Paenibacillus alginolyticus]MCY9697187.1 P-loop NTPase fold protein [Paenibacillus alginolyticus]MEC0145376.1 P-loop NTPase fold protein [Paenibacillus alginolyticus]